MIQMLKRGIPNLIKVITCPCCQTIFSFEPSDMEICYNKPIIHCPNCGSALTYTLPYDDEDEDDDEEY